MKTILGIDIGTSGTKTILVDDQGRVIAAKTIEYPMETPKPGWTQQNPQDWWNPFARCWQRPMCPHRTSLPSDCPARCTAW